MTKRARILVLTSGPLCRHPRAFRAAQTLGLAGYDVTALTVATRPEFEQVDQRLLDGAAFRKCALPLGIRQSATRAATWLARKAAARGIQSLRAFGPYVPLRARARAFAADLTLAHTELGLCVARDLMRQGRRVAADFEDWHSEDLLPEARRSRPLRLLREVECDLLKGATFTSTTSESLASALATIARSPKPLVLTNSLPLQPNPLPRASASEIRLVWFSQTIGPGRGLEAFVQAWALTKTPSRLRLLGAIAPDYRSSLLRDLPADRARNLEFVAPLEPRQVPGFVAQHDLGLALEPSTPASRNLTITIKLLQYLNAGVGVLATSTAGQREAIGRAAGAGVLIDTANPASLAQLLDELFADRNRVVEMGRAARHAAETTYCWEREAPLLVQAVERALNQTPSIRA
jgi:glycosyltransferase involved in cell wall biosynthesis